MTGVTPGLTDVRQRIYDHYLDSPQNRYKYADELPELQWVRYAAYYRRFLPADVHARIIDLGCGSGGFVSWLRHIGYKRATGVEGSAQQIEVGQSRGIDGLIKADVFGYLETHRGALDAVTLHDVIEHFSKDEILRLLDLCYAALRPSGIVICSVPNGSAPLVGHILYGDFTHETCFTPVSIEQVLLTAGFRKVRVYPKEPVVHTARSAVRWLLWQGLKQAIHVYYAISTGARESGIYTEVIYAVAVKPTNQEARTTDCASA